jgi:hypothetical protein
MNLIARFLFLITILLTCCSVYSANQEPITFSSENKANELIESNINKSASALNISQPSIHGLEITMVLLQLLSIKIKK